MSTNSHTSDSSAHTRAGPTQDGINKAPAGADKSAELGPAAVEEGQLEKGKSDERDQDGVKVVDGVHMVGLSGPDDPTS